MTIRIIRKQDLAGTERNVKATQIKNCVQMAQRL